MTALYATEADYQLWADDTSRTASAADLRSASLMVARAIRGARYAADPAGKPTDPDLLQAVRDATCAVLDARGVGVEDETATSPLGGVTGATIEGVSYTLAPDQRQADRHAAQQAALTVLPTDAWLILADAGLTDHTPVVWG